MRKALAVTVAFQLACASCGIDFPDPPDLSPQLAEYEPPDAPVSVETIRVQAGRIKELARIITSYQLVLPTLRLLAVGIQKLRADSTDEGEDSGGGINIRDRLSIDAVVTLQRTCPGWEPGPADFETNGGIELTLVVRDTQIESVTWAEIDHCRPSPRWPDFDQIELNGQLRAHLGGLIPLRDRALNQVLFDFDGNALENGLEAARKLHFKSDDQERFQLPIVLEDGRRLLVRGRPGSGSFEITGANGVWTCRLREKSCDNGTKSFSW